MSLRNSPIHVLRAALVGVCLLWPVSAQADVSANEILQQYDASSANGRATWEAILAQTESGLGYANAYLEHTRNAAPLYCPPPQLALTGVQLINIVRRAIRNDPHLGEQPLGFVTLTALQRVFPCSRR